MRIGNKTVREIQKALNDNHGWDISEDNIMGPETENAIKVTKARFGLHKRVYVGPKTLDTIFNKTSHSENKATPASEDRFIPPWIEEANKYMGLEEHTDNKELSKFLASDGHALGDPAKYPWCGDFIETCVRLSLPNEPFEGKLKENPYWAKNWQYFGNSHKLAYGTVIVLSRNGGGHVCFAIGYDPKRKLIRVKGGNQNNRVSDIWISETRLLGYREDINIRRDKIKGIRSPFTYLNNLPVIPILDSRSGRISRNEA